MGTALYRSYRSTSFDEIIGQDHIVTVLKNALDAQKISHAYLLTGPRGVGKTSVARILAYAVNGVEYAKGGAHLDIIEIDAASNRRIDEVREIRERVMIAPAQAKYKVYIIDEVHMLTREAFNALLKTLEEPPEHAIFILATTELHKVPETIISRCIRLTFNPIPKDLIVSHLKQIAKQEKIAIKPDALELIAEHAAGGFRDAITLLEQVAHQSETVSLSTVESMLGLASHQHIEAIMAAVLTQDIQRVQAALDALYEAGSNEAITASQLMAAIRGAINDKQHAHIMHKLIKLQRALLQVAGSSIPRTQLELALYEFCIPSEPVIPNQVLADMQGPTPTQSQPSKNDMPTMSTPKSPEQASPIKKVDQPTEAKKQSSVAAPPKAVQQTGDACWPAVLDRVRNTNNTLYAIARMAEVNETENRVTLIFTFPFHYKQMQESKNKAVFSAILSELCGGAKTIEIELATVESAPKSATKETPVSDALASVSNIFGGHEVLES